MAGEDRVAVDVVDVQRLLFSFRGSATLLLVIFLAQPFLLSWPESSGTTAAFGGVLAELCEIESAKPLGLWVAAQGWEKGS